MIHHRDARADDRRYVVSTWVQSFADASPWSRKLATRHHAKAVDAILDRPTIRAVVLYVADERAIQAWACAEAGTLHYVYVPPELRGHGLARRAMREVLGGYPAHFDASHPWPCRDPKHVRCTNVACPARGQRTRFNPYALWGAEEAA